MRFIETIFVISLFLIYLGLWRIKRISQIKSTGTDPAVIGKSASSLQKYVSRLFRIITLYAVLIIIAHTAGLQYASLFSRFNKLSSIHADIAGLIIGLSGLAICAYAQMKMGKSWRVGIDENTKTDLITTGLYKYIRNPTYLGLFMLNLGVWIIWPTWTVFVLNFAFILVLEFQVRCEEDFLIASHGNEYLVYMKKTKRYLPFIY